MLTDLGGDPDSPELYLFVVGALDDGGCAAAASPLLQLATTCRRLCMDLSEVTMLSAAGFGLLLRLHQAVARNGGGLELRAVSPAAREVLEILNWTEVSRAVVEMGTP